jgi:AraC-like DNA-binding protein
MSGGIDAGGEWSMHFPMNEGIIRCFALISGTCWLSVVGVSAPVRLRAGDCILLPKGQTFTLASDLALTPVNIGEIVSAPLNGGIISYNGGGNCFGVTSFFKLTGNHADILLGVLPPVVHIQRESDKAAIRWCVERMMQELRDPQPGGFLVSQQLAYMMLVQAIRLYLKEGLKGGVGWLFALADKQMNAAITSIHVDPAHRWTVQELAHCAGMSRSIFAIRFKETVGTSPMGYLTRWRVMLAAERLTNSDEPVSAIAISMGYESQSAFRKAFKNVMGCSPREYTNTRKVAS